MGFRIRPTPKSREARDERRLPTNLGIRAGLELPDYLSDNFEIKTPEALDERDSLKIT